MIWVDYTILGIIGLSSLVSLMRGFVKEAMSLAVWIAAFLSQACFMNISPSSLLTLSPNP